MNKPRFITLVAMTLIAALSRLVPHAWNVTPVAAMALFAGAHFNDKRAAFFVPLAAMLASDLVLGLHLTMLSTYPCLALIVLIGRKIQYQKSLAVVGGASLASSLLFFFITNFACWITMVEYTKDWSGLVSCYAMAVPFFRNTVAGDLVFTGLLFGSFALSEKAFPRLRNASQPA